MQIEEKKWGKGSILQTSLCVNALLAEISFLFILPDLDTGLFSTLMIAILNSPMNAMLRISWVFPLSLGFAAVSVSPRHMGVQDVLSTTIW